MADSSDNKDVAAENVKANPWAGHELPIPNYPAKVLTKIDKWFEISNRGSSYGKELMGGLTTFISMVYICALNPTILSVKEPQLWNSVFIATCLASFIATVVMALVPNVPFALSCGLGLNAQVLGYTLGQAGPMYTFGGAMTIVFLSGVIFLVVTLVGFREYIFESLPQAVKSAIPVGIGLFIAFIGLQNASIVADDSSTKVTMVQIKNMYLDKDVRDMAFSAIVCFIGLFVICVLDHFRIKGCVFIGIVFAALIGIAFGVTPVKNITTGWNVGERFANFFSFNSDKGGTFGLCFPGFKDAFTPGSKVPTTIVLIIAYGMVDLFDTLGTIYGLGLQSNLLDQKTGKCHNFSRVLFADCIGAVFGSVFGTSSVTTYVESSTGIAVGGRTGLTSLTVAVLFLLSIFVSPIFNMIPGCATAPALIYVGVQMMSTVLYIDFSHIIDAIPIFVTIIFMPMTYSITNGMCYGVITYSVVHILRFLIDCVYYLITGHMYNPNKAAAAVEPAETKPVSSSSSDTPAAEKAKDPSTTSEDVTQVTPVSDSSEGEAAAPAADNAPAVEAAVAVAAPAAAEKTVKAEEGKKTEAEEPTKPVWPINIGLGVITILFALTVLLPTKFTNN